MPKVVPKLLVRLVQWDLDEIVVGERLRKELKEDAVLELMQSIQRLGLRQPPTIRIEIDERNRETAFLVAGLHRLEACKRLGMTAIECWKFSGSETEGRLWEIAENLHRAELTPDERDEHIREWFKLTKQEDKMAAGGHFSENATVGAGRGNEGGLREFTREFNLPRTTVQEALDLEDLDPTAKEQADAAGLNRKEKLKVVRTAKKDPDRQKAKVRELAAHKAQPMTDVDREFGRLMAAWSAAGDEARRMFMRVVVQDGWCDDCDDVTRH